MHSFLRQSTASQSRSIGPFLDDTDFKTAETGLTIANTDIKLMINGAASANKNSGGGTHRANGVYGVTFDATDSATVGEIYVSVVVSGALPVFATFVVLEEAVYDALFAASALGYVANAPVNVAQFGGNNGTFSSGRPEVNTTHAAGTAWGSGAITAASIASNAIALAKVATDLRQLLGAMTTGTAAAIADGTITLASGHGITNSASVLVFLTGGTNAVGKSRIATYSGSGDVFNVSPAWNANGETTPSGTITYVVMPLPLGSTASPPTVNVTQIGGDAQSLTDLKDFADAGYDPATNKVQGVVLTDTVTTYTGNTPQTGDSFARLGAPAGASHAADVAGVKTQTAAIETDTQDIQSRLPAALIGGRMNSDMEAINNVAVTGDGSGTPFGV